MNCVSCDICVYNLWFVLCFSLGYSSAPECLESLSCDHGLDYAS